MATIAIKSPPLSRPAADTADGRSNVEANNPSTSGIPAGSPSLSFWYRLNRIILRLCSTHQFKNLQVSYLKLNHTSSHSLPPYLTSSLFPLPFRNFHLVKVQLSSSISQLSIVLEYYFWYIPAERYIYFWVKISGEFSVLLWGLFILGKSSRVFI